MTQLLRKHLNDGSLPQITADANDEKHFERFKGDSWSGISRRAKKKADFLNGKCPIPVGPRSKMMRVSQFNLGKAKLDALKELTTHEIAAVAGYTSEDFKYLNPILRGKKTRQSSTS